MLVIGVSILVFLIDSSVSTEPPEFINYDWKYINFTWPSREIYENAVASGDYVKEENPLAGIKIWRDKIYLTIPRWRDGVPATLLVAPLKPVNGNKSPNLQPYPNWDMQRIGNCSAFQFVQSMEIDPQGRMWILDTGRVAILTDNPKNYCPARLVVLDLENNGKIVLNYVFPENVVNRETVYLNDIVLDHEDGGYAYITDADEEDPGIVVFSLRDKKSWRVSHESMKATDIEFTVKFDGTKVTRPINVDSIALSPSTSRERILYYSPLSSRQLFSIPTRILKSRVTIDRHVRRLGNRGSQTDGMVMTARGRLYFGLLADNVVAAWNEGTLPFSTSLRSVFLDNRTLQWPDTFAIDQHGGLWCVANRLQTFLADSVDANEINYRVIKLANLGSRNYQYYADGRVPTLPVIRG